MTPENIMLPDRQTRDCRRFISVPLCRQETAYTCGAACVQSILGVYGMDYRQDELAQILDAKPLLGTDYHKIILFMKMLGFQASYVKNMGIDNLKSFINDRVTPLLQIQAWAENGVDYASGWQNAHYVIACGYDGNQIFFMDPWTLGNYTYLPAEELLKRWHVPGLHFVQCYGSGLIITKEHGDPLYDPSIIKYLG